VSRDGRCRQHQSDARRRAEHAGLAENPGDDRGQVAWISEPAVTGRQHRGRVAGLGETLPPCADRRLGIPVLLDEPPHGVGELGRGRQIGCTHECEVYTYDEYSVMSQPWRRDLFRVLPHQAHYHAAG